MDLNNKLFGIPHIYYFNLDNRSDRRDWMESQFHQLNITNYTRISGSKYLGSKYEEWKFLINDIEKIEKQFGEGYNFSVPGNTITHIEFLSSWLESTNDEHLILMEDDYDLSLIEYWHFDWNYLMNHIPYDWDCIQLGYESFTEVQFFLSPKPQFGTFFGPCLLNRRYVKKIVELHYKNGIFFLNKKVNNFTVFDPLVNVDYFICENGRTYCLPLITMNNDFGSYEMNIHRHLEHHVKCKKLYYNWWKNDKDKFTLEDFFTYGKPYDYLMTKRVNV